MSELNEIVFLGPGESPLGPTLAARPRRVVIAVDSHRCVAALLDRSSGAARESRRSMFYRLEEQVPFAAEEMWADFIATDSGTLGICTPAADVLPVATALADAGIVVTAICPTALLSLQNVFNGGAAEPGRWDVLLWETGKEVEIYFLHEASLIAWHVVPNESVDVGRILFAALADSPTPPRIGAIDFEPKLLESLRDMEPAWGISQIAPPHNWRESATRAAQEIAKGRSSPMVDLRGVDANGVRRQSQLTAAGRAAMTAFAILCAASIFAMACRGVRYHARIATAEGQTRSAYVSVFPHSAIPLGIESRLSSVCQSLNARAFVSGNGGAVADPWLLPLLDRSLRQLPSDIRFSVNSLRLEDHQFVMEGQTRTFADADALAAALRAAPGLSVDEPQTQRADAVVAFTLSGRLADRQLRAERETR